MSYDQIRLELDPTGININNRIIDEPHSLSNRPTRSIAPNYGAFFAKSLYITDGGRKLERGVDYQVVELHQEATLKFGKEISSVILIINKNVSPNVKVTYQALGGYYSYNDKTLANLYQSVITDARPVDFSNIENKPSEYNPTIHRHLLDDIYGFEPVVDHLERIKRAITLGQTQVIVEIVNTLLAQFTRQQLLDIIPTTKIIQHDALLYILTRHELISNIWVDVGEDVFTKGRSARFKAGTHSYPPGTVFYWELYKEGANVALFTTKKGQFIGNGDVVEFDVYVPSNPLINEDNIYLGIKTDPDAEDYLAVTYRLKFKDTPTTECAYPHMLINRQDKTDFDVMIHVVDQNDEIRTWQQMYFY